MSNSDTQITKKAKPSEIETKDTLSDLPECIILHTLSFLNAKHAVQTYVLSTRWKNLWKLLPTLRFDSIDFRLYKNFTKFVSRVLSLRSSSITLQALEFKREWGRLEPHLLKRIVNYTISHNVQRLGLWFYTVLAHIPPTMFSCHTLTHLKLATYPNGGHETLFPKSFNLPALTSLQLESFGFCVGDNDRAEPFSTFNKLNSLIITNCTLSGAGTLCISSATLMNLAMYTHFRRLDSIDLCTPSLCTFAFVGSPQKLSGSDVSSLKHVDIAVNKVDPPLLLLSWLQELPNIKSLTVSSTTLQVLYLTHDLLKTDLPALGNLKSLRVKMEPFSPVFLKVMRDAMLQKVKSKKEAAKLQKAFRDGLIPSSLIPDGIVDFLLQNSPSAKVDYIDCSRLPLREIQI